MGLLAVILIRPDPACGKDTATGGLVTGTDEDGGGEVAPKNAGVVGTAEPVCSTGDRESSPDSLGSSPVSTWEMLLALT